MCTTALVSSSMNPAPRKNMRAEIESNSPSPVRRANNQSMIADTNAMMPIPRHESVGIIGFRRYRNGQASSASRRSSGISTAAGLSVSSPDPAFKSNQSGDDGDGASLEESRSEERRVGKE